MKTAVYTSKDISEEAFRELYREVTTKFGRYDYLLFSIYPSLDMQESAQHIETLFQTDKFAAFHAIEHFSNRDIVKESISVCCFAFEKEAYIETFAIADVAAESALQEAANYFNEKSDKFHIILAGLCSGDIAPVIDRLSAKLNYEPIDNIVGGVSSGFLQKSMMQTYQYIDKQLITNGFVILSFSNVEAAIEVSLGFKAYGITYEVTKAVGNRLYEVDNGENFAAIMLKMLNATNEYADIRNLWYAPITVLSGENGYRSTMRTVSDCTEEYIEFFAPVKEGDYIKLSFATEEDIIEADKDAAALLIQKIQNPEISLNFSCIARQYILEDLQKREIEVYEDTFKTTLFGFFTFGEIGPDTMYKKLSFYNETSLAVLIREKDA